MYVTKEFENMRKKNESKKMTKSTTFLKFMNEIFQNLRIL